MDNPVDMWKTHGCGSTAVTPTGPLSPRPRQASHPAPGGRTMDHRTPSDPPTAPRRGHAGAAAGATSRRRLRSLPVPGSGRTSRGGASLAARRPCRSSSAVSFAVSFRA